MDPNQQSNSQVTSPPQNVPQDVPIDVPPPGSPIKKIIFIAGGIILVLILALIGYFFLWPIFQPKPVEDVTLTYWGVWDDEQVFADVINQFEAENPHVTVKYEKQDIATLGDTVTRLKTRIAEGNGPDVFRFHNSWTRQLVTGGSTYLLPLPDDVIEATGLKDKYYPVVKEDVNVGGAYYGIPLYIDTLALFVNDDAFQEGGYAYPTDWEYFVDLSRELTFVEDQDRVRKVTRPGVALGTYDNVEHAADIVSLLLAQSNINADNIASSSSQTTIGEVLNYYTCFAKQSPVCEIIWNNEQQNSKVAFATGNLPMFFGYSYDIIEMKAINPNLKFSIIPVPILNPANPTALASYWVEGVSASSKHPEEALKFLQFLAKKESMQIIYANQVKSYGVGGIYPRRDMANILSGNKLMAPFIEQASYAHSSLFYSNTFDDALNTNLNTSLSEAINAIITGKGSLESVTEQFIKQVSLILNPQAAQDK